MLPLEVVTPFYFKVSQVDLSITFSTEGVKPLYSMNIRNCTAFKKLVLFFF